VGFEVFKSSSLRTDSISHNETSLDCFEITAASVLDTQLPDSPQEQQHPTVAATIW
jgi:hypothetical protein